METWVGNKENGICLREDTKGILDEALLYINGACVMHLESMSDVNYWIGLYAGEHSVHLNVYSRSLRANVDATAEEQ